VKFSPNGFAAAALTFVLSVVLVYFVYGFVPTVFDGPFEGEGEYHCLH
jgi:hypothetical protein